MAAHKTQEILRVEVKADVYGGKTCDEVSNYFNVYAEGDMQDSNDKEDIVLKCKEMPPGTRISVEYPSCPNCTEPRHDVVEAGKGITGHVKFCSGCGFNWEKWVLDNYS